MDNLFLFGKSKKEIHRMVREIETFLWNALRLELNGSKQVFRFEYAPKFKIKEPLKNSTFKAERGNGLLGTG